MEASKDLADLEPERRVHRLLGKLYTVDPPMDEHLAVGRDRFGHRDAGCERCLLQTEDVGGPVRPVAIEPELLHREHALVGL